jgi:lipopolysaccharide export system protein LptA
MRWQRVARLGIAVFVIVFAGVVFVAMRRGRSVPPANDAPVLRTDDNAISEDRGGIYEYTKADKTQAKITWKHRLSYEDGRSKLRGLSLTLPDRNGRSFTVTSQDAEVLMPPGKELTTARLVRDVRLVTSDGLMVTSGEATYDDREGMVKVPGPVEFTRGRLSGNGIGATYDRNRDVLWLLDQAQIFIAPDTAGSGKVDATAGAAGLARGEHFVRLSRAAHVVTDGRTMDADEITAVLTPDDKQIQTMQLRGNSRITGTGTAAQAMSAKDIDLTYGADGRTLQNARLMEQSVVQMAGEGGSSRRIAARTIDMTMSPDGAAVTQLNANESVVVDLPPDADGPARQIRAAVLRASGASAGLQSASFEGGVEFRETRPVRGSMPAVARTARSSRLILETKPGFGAVQQADFHGDFSFTDGAELSAESPRALYHIDRDQIDLSPFTGDAGSGPRVSDGKVTVDARNIQFSPSTRKLSADTDVRSVVRPQRQGSGNADSTQGQARVPVMLKADRPINATSNRLTYEGGSLATYSGDATLWQDDSRVQADTIVIDDKTGNLTARGRVRTRMMLEDVDPKTKQRKAAPTTATAESLVYDDAKRLATYSSSPTMPAHLTGPQGDVTGDRVELYLKESGNELERFEAHDKVVVQDSLRTAKGAHLVYTAADDNYVITGAPVEVIEKTDSGCQQTFASTVKFNRTVDRVETEGDRARVNSRSIACPERRF